MKTLNVYDLTYYCQRSTEEGLKTKCVFVRYLMESFCDLNLKCVILAGVVLAPADYILPEKFRPIWWVLLECVSRVSAFGIGTRYGLWRSGDRIPVGGRNFPLPARTALEPTSLLDNGEPVSFPGVKRPG